jgi:very-short-patch-repair endonuclease
VNSFPTLAAELIAESFPFASWAAATQFTFPAPASRFLARSGSAAEAFFLRAITTDHQILVFDEGNGARYQTATGTKAVVTPQLRCFQYHIDAAVVSKNTKLAVEIDGMGFHHRTAEQVAADYIRARRLTLAGYAVIRFTAREAFNEPAECWRQIDAILDARSSASADEG